MLKKTDAEKDQSLTQAARMAMRLKMNTQVTACLAPWF
jgi:hypothetical protein